MNKPKIGVVGGGAVGLCVVSTLVQAGLDVTLLVRDKSVSSLQNRSILISGVLGSHEISADRFTVDSAENPSVETLSAEILLVATKSYDVGSALKPFTSSKTLRAVILLQNGLGALEIAKEVMGEQTPVFCSAVYTGMEKLDSNSVLVSAYVAPIQVGSMLDESCDPIKPLLDCGDKGFLPLAWSAQIRTAILNKVLLNCCLNATGSLTGGIYGELLTNQSSKEVIVKIADEAVKVFAAKWHFETAGSGLEYVTEKLMPMIFPKAESHHSSMLMDIEAGRKTEIDFLNGAIVSLGKETDIPTPTNQLIVELIRAKEAHQIAEAVKQ